MNRIIKSISKLYDEVATYWSHTRKYLWPDILPYLEEINKGDTVLDIGCGNGRLLTGLSKDVDYVGVDISQGLIREAQKLHKNNLFYIGDVTKMDIWKKLPTADAIFCVAVLHHLPYKSNHKFLIDQMYSKLKPGGFLYLTVQNFWGRKFYKHHFNLRSILAKLLNFRWLYMPFGKERKWRFMYAFSKRQLVELVQKSGFEVDEAYFSNKKKINVKRLEGYNLVLVLSKSA